MKPVIQFVFYFLFVFISFVSCRQNPVKQIRSHAVFFYAGYNGDFRTADRSVFTKELGELMDKAAFVEKAEAAAMKASATPYDKPPMLEGDVLCGLYEGFDKYEVREIRDLGDNAEVSVELKNTAYKIKWSDTLIMKKQDRWKIDDIRFGKKQASASSARDVFIQFIDHKNN